ncbi:RDD family protein [Microbispora sp. H13382]|uniref:RDD family protein n=1 Tax=Microbispora sp. H13382 TaxID=2729112 RepID=UPI001601B394|nr:RDD family protein [Microbispora sp. H13382]
MPPPSRLSSLAIPALLAAVALAAVPTWELWREKWELERILEGGEGSFEIYGCIGMLGADEWPLAAIRDDLSRVVETAESWAVPALAVFLGLLAYVRGKDPQVVGRRVAGLLVLTAVAEPLIPLYSEPGGCGGTVPLLSADWFGRVLGNWGANQLCLLPAAALVYAASRTRRRAAEPGVAATGAAWRRPVAAFIDYVIVVVALRVVVEPAWALIGSHYLWFPWFHQGLLGRLDEVFESTVKPGEVLALTSWLLYFWLQHTVWGRTPGKWLLRLRLVNVRTGGRLGAGRAALRTLAFPFLAVVPDVGLVLLFAGGLAALFDADGQVLHDRLLGAAVVRHRPRRFDTEGDRHVTDLA